MRPKTVIKWFINSIRDKFLTPVQSKLTRSWCTCLPEGEIGDSASNHFRTSSAVVFKIPGMYVNVEHELAQDYHIDRDLNGTRSNRILYPSWTNVRRLPLPNDPSEEWRLVTCRPNPFPRAIDETTLTNDPLPARHQ
ncbi:hypothetical protein CHS0354_017882 [Potamilus streckersoni]|uniref:Uncharacterized protein n=1 Tax=Potamilus streckersoni TaxID=2493646 RepID=A0AAE0T3N4_9BIVA|nr:hypothetical protein CHS0354_017882 [Potamilus streckersoni]